MYDQNVSIHILAGGIAGTIGAVATNPLEVVKTRFQSSYHSNYNKIISQNANFCTQNVNNNTIAFNKNQRASSFFNFTIYYQLKTITKNEGFGALYKGLIPTLLGVAPYRGIYFYTYEYGKLVLSSRFQEDKYPIINHLLASSIAAFSAVTFTNPLWLIKTRLQLDLSKAGTTTLSVIQKIYREKGLLGFYKGISASYFGILETVIYFVVYEELKKVTLNYAEIPLVGYMFSSVSSKIIATCSFYPHEVARTRLRQEGDKYKGFVQTIKLVIKEEGFKSLYKGLGTHLIRQIPNNLIVMTTYELITDYLRKKKK